MGFTTTSSYMQITFYYIHPLSSFVPLTPAFYFPISPLLLLCVWPSELVLLTGTWVLTVAIPLKRRCLPSPGWGLLGQLFIYFLTRSLIKPRLVLNLLGSQG